ncbi:MAG: formylglycine-generating enzyme family protein, partial [Hyphomonadaceae bacterium]|nr:formylglycine-generating enzyme family protein [Hyphomonadaceae bacterium]
WRRDVVVADAPADAPPPVETAPVAPQQRSVFRDCDDCPEMMRLSGGAFLMGARASDDARPWELPLHEVTLAPYAIGVREVTFAEWDACVADGGCSAYLPPDRGWGRGDRPVMMVSWRDAQRYVRWLSDKTGRPYRLPTEAEWEFAARAGTETRYWWGDAFEPDRAPSRQTADTGTIAENPFGLRGVTGNVAEWVEDCYANSFVDAPNTGAAVSRGDCARRVTRGGSWRDGAASLRIASRSRVGQTVRDAGIGFRVALSE